MKKVFLIALLIAIFVLSSCGGVVTSQGTCNCFSKALFDAVQPLLMTEGFTVTQRDDEAGILIAETAETTNFWTGGYEKKVWQIYNVNGKITASAKVVTLSKNMFGATNSASEIYYNSGSHDSHTWYWDIRNLIEAKCNAKLTDVKK